MRIEFDALLSRVHGDVFRSPSSGMLLSVLIGNGLQIAIMSFVTLSTSSRLCDAVRLALV